ncbi:4c6c7ecf-7255-446a-b07a-8e1abfa5d975 [Sclerotinia trifoliorum]|uniref:4c6c7ecf-7255-446a-b07a-8e1abfa5d975 n=1 Tax=Sclerotinia trifoliorum TaxID=28548 RepID=A0A8H2ZUM2_9HELO|nr:4c6c7ecf-7255-446a-b07a-8e1abfa5d975 [Sclerotinia trifoliorum]
MSLANLLSPMTKSYVDEVNDDFEEQFSNDIISTSYDVDTSRLDHDLEMKDAEALPPDFTNYGDLEYLDEEYIFDSYHYDSKAGMMSNNEGDDGVISSDEILAFNTNALEKYIEINIPSTFLSSIPGSDAGTFFDIELEKEEHNEKSRDEDQNGTTSSVETCENYKNHPPAHLDSRSSELNSVQNSPDLSSSVFWSHGSNYSLQTEDDEEDFRIDHPLMGKDVICIQETFAKVKICEYGAHPPKTFYRGWVSMPCFLIP